MKLTKLIRWIAHRLPARLKYFVFLDVIGYGTCGKYGNTNVHDVTAMEVLKRFSEDKKVY